MVAWYRQIFGISLLLLFITDVLGARRPGEVVIKKASATMPDGPTVEFELGTLYVPENREDANSRVIGIGFARVRALEPTGAPPTFHLPGGPGFSLVSGLLENPGRLRQIARYRTAADVILVDQRGYSERGNVLRFNYHASAEPLDQPASLVRSTSAFVETARAAVAEFKSKGFDLRGYDVKQCADDVDDLRKALGYSQITLVGTSFGSQWSFAIMRRHPAIVARALLCGIEPLDAGYDMPSHVFAAARRIWWQAEQDPAIKPYLPSGGLAAAATEVLRRLAHTTAVVPVKDPHTGETSRVTLGSEDFKRDAFLKGAAGPAFVLSAYYEHYEDWAASVLSNRKSHEASLRLIGPLIDTSLGVTPRRRFLLETDPATEFLGKWAFDSYLGSADVWPTVDVGDAFRTDAECQIPVVFVHGDWDAQTPIENALAVAPFFPRGRLLVVEHGGHAILGTIADHFPAVRDALLKFLRTGSMQSLPLRVALPVPKFPPPAFPAPGAKQR